MNKAILTTLTPVHIGNGQTLNKNVDFVQEGSKIGFIDLDKIVNLIGIEQIDQLTNVIEDGKPMLDYLRNGRGLKNPIEEFCYRICRANNISQTTSQLKEHYHTPLRGVCIPGSSLKGSIKTAIWSYLADDNFLNTVQTNDLGYWKQRGGNQRWNWKDEKIDKRLFGYTANEKLTRFIKPGDIHFQNIDTEIEETIILNKRNDEWEIKDERFLSEVVPANAQATFQIKIDKMLFARNKKKYPNKWNSRTISFLEENQLKLSSIINKSTIHLLETIELSDIENEALNNEGDEMLYTLKTVLKNAKSCKQNEFIIRVGSNSGWNFTTGGWVKSIPVDNMSNKDYNDLRYTIQKKDYSQMDLWPKTRKVAKTGIPFGFVKITLQ